MTAYKLMRTLDGDEVVAGWLSAALEEVQTTPPDISIRLPN